MGNSAVMRSPVTATYFEERHAALREKVRAFVAQEIAPHVDAWEASKTFPRELYRKAGAAGFLGLGFPEAYGGTPCDIFHEVVYTEEIIRCGSVGLASSLGSSAIALPPILALGTPAQKERFIPPVLQGAKIAVLAVTEPSGGSDVAHLQTVAEKRKDRYIVNGTKCFITSGTRADMVTAAVRTGGPGAGGISLLVVEAHCPGFSASCGYAKMGWHASDTAEIAFNHCDVPAANLIGEENKGFAGIMVNFQKERLLLALEAQTVAEMALSEAMAIVGRSAPSGANQALRHALAEMATQLEAARCFNYANAAAIGRGANVLAQVCMGKNFSAGVCRRIVDQALDIAAHEGCLVNPFLERLFRDSRVFPIGGGTHEIMNEIIAKKMGLETQR
jgi:acyl-CoA dehydrogenase